LRSTSPCDFKPHPREEGDEQLAIRIGMSTKFPRKVGDMPSSEIHAELIAPNSHALAGDERGWVRDHETHCVDQNPRSMLVP
tara:strand:+ start:2740 stop:2985 length:246 start_codon:yes stop_codon:yes gene_type:complete